MVARTIRPRLALGWTQMLLTLGIAWTAYMVPNIAAYWPINPLLNQPLANFQLDMARCCGRSCRPRYSGEPVPARSGGRGVSGQRSGRLVGSVYAANTLGAIVGALSVSLIVVPWFGTQQAQRAMLLTAAAGSALVLLVAAHTEIPLDGAGGRTRLRRRRWPDSWRPVGPVPGN